MLKLNVLFGWFHVTLTEPYVCLGLVYVKQVIGQTEEEKLGNCLLSVVY